MNDFERKLRDTPLRQPPAKWRAEILDPLPAHDAPAENAAARWSSSASPGRLFGKETEARSSRATRPLLAFLTKPATIFCLFIVTVVTGGAALFVGANSAGRTAWERYSDDARARGVKMSLQEMLPARVPDAENFAAVPLFANLFSDDEAVRKKASDALGLNFLERGNEARHTAFSTATLCRLADWQVSFVKTGDLPAASADPAADVLRAIAHRFGPDLAELAEAERRPHAVFPVKWELGIAAMLPHIQQIQKAAKVHVLRLSAHLAQRDSTAAYAEFRGLLRLYRALEKEPTLISGLVRISVLQLAVSGVWEGVITGAWDPASLEKIQNDVADLDLLADALFAFSAERAFMNSVLDSARSGNAPIDGTWGGFSNDNMGWDMILRAIPKIPGWISLNQIAMNRFYDQFPARIDVAAARFHDTGETDAEVQAIDRSIVKQHIYVLYRLMVPSFMVVEKKFLHTHTALQPSALACALERCRLADGAYPETLASQVPRYVSALPHDVMTGEPLHYRRTADGKFLLYSVAGNGTDDGGAIGEKKTDSTPLDWAWRWPAP